MRTFVQTRRLPENIFANFQYKSPYSSQDLNSRLSQEINSLCNRWVSIYSPFLTPWWKLQRGYVMAALHPPALSAPALQTWLCWALSLHVKSLEPNKKQTNPPQRLLRLDCYSYKEQFWTSVLFPFQRDEREGVTEADKLWASTLEQLDPTGFTMEFRGVCVLLGVLLLIDNSFQQTTSKKRPVKKGKWRKRHIFVESW